VKIIKNKIEMLFKKVIQITKNNQFVINYIMSSITTFWGNSEQKLFSDEVIWCSSYTAIVHFNRIHVKLLESISNEIENRYYIQKINNKYQYIGKVLSWNVIKVEKGYADLELVIKQCPKNKEIIFYTKNDVCTYFGFTYIQNEDFVKKIIKH